MANGNRAAKAISVAKEFRSRAMRQMLKAVYALRDVEEPLLKIPKVRRMFPKVETTSGARHRPTVTTSASDTPLHSRNPTTSTDTSGKRKLPLQDENAHSVALTSNEMADREYPDAPLSG